MSEQLDDLEAQIQQEEQQPQGIIEKLFYDADKLKKDIVAEVYNKFPTLTANQVYKDWKTFFGNQAEDINKSYLYNEWKKLQPKQEETETKEPTESTVQIAEEPTQEEIKFAEEQAKMPLGDVTKAIMAGVIKKEQIKAIFIIENKMLKTVFGEECQHDTETIDLMAGLWEQPLNRIFQKYTDQNSDLYIAFGVTVYAHLPLILKLWKGKK